MHIEQGFPREKGLEKTDKQLKISRQPVQEVQDYLEMLNRERNNFLKQQPDLNSRLFTQLQKEPLDPCGPFSHIGTKNTEILMKKSKTNKNVKSTKSKKQKKKKGDDDE